MREQLRPECRWVPVVDGSGRRRLEMRWLRAAPVSTGTAVAQEPQAA